MIKKSLFGIVSVCCLILFSSVNSYAVQTLTAQKVDKAPVVDGLADDEAWSRAGTITTHDTVADIDITLKSVYTNDRVYFLVTFPDKDESATHRSWQWNKESKEYESGRDREDSFVLKWNLGDEPVDLSAYADNPYKADIWYWKACRTNPAGYADDKLQRLSALNGKESKEVTSKTGNKMYLQRTGDPGQSAYKSTLPVDYEGDVIARFMMQQPTESRADIAAKGVWKDGMWTIEFGRNLITADQESDVQLDLAQTYQFGVSRYEIAGRFPEVEADQPLFGSGDVGEELTLKFSH